MVKRKKILFVCNYFAPDATIAAIRTTKLAKYLQKTGFEVDFLTVKNSNLSRDEIIADEVNGIKVVYGHSTNNFLKFEKIIRDLITPIKEKRFADISNRRRINSVTGHEEFFPFETAYPVIGSVEYVLNLAKQKDLFRSVRLWLDQAGSYDYLITSYGDAFCYFAGLYYKKRHSETKWVFDIRDSIYRYKFTPKYVSFIPRLMEKKFG